MVGSRGNEKVKFRNASNLKRLFVFSLFSLLLLPLIPILLSTWLIYQDEVKRVESHLQETNHQVAFLADQAFNAQIRQIALVLSDEKLDSSVLKTNAILSWIDVDQNQTIVATNHPDFNLKEALPFYPEWKEFNQPGNTKYQISDIVDIDLISGSTFLIRIPWEKGYRIAVIDYQKFRTWLTSNFETFFNRHVYVVDSTGRPLFYSDMKLIDRVDAFQANPPIKFLLSGKSGAIRYISTISQNERIGYVLPMAELGWGLIVSADLGNRIFALRERILWILGAFLISGLVALGIFFNINRKVMSPLLSITEQLHKQGMDEYKQVRLPNGARSVDEFNLFVNEFNQYAKQVIKAKREGIQAEKMATMGELTTGLAHELGTPLNVIRGNAQYLAKKMAAEDTNRALIDKIILQTDRISDLLRSLLDVARIDAAGSENVVLEKVIKRALKTIGEIYTQTKIHLDTEENLPAIHGFSRRLEHAFLNVFDNACQAMSGQGELWISLKTTTDEDIPSLLVAIEDVGSGIAPEDLPNIFQPFYSTKGSGKGTGLGLALVDRVIKEHDGTVKVNSIPCKGTLFLFSFPVSNMPKESL